MNFELVIITVFGLIIGSFLNVCIYRLPREKNIVVPSSSCVICGEAIKPYDNIPLISFLILKGKCRACGAKISWRYPFVELLNSFFYLLAYTRFGLSFELIPIFLFLSTMIVITFIDLDFQIIPDSITLPGILIGIAFSSFLFPDPFELNSITGFINSLIGFIIGGGLFFLIALLSKGGMGGGDIKMMAMIGAFFGWKGVLTTTLIASLVGSVVGISLVLFKGKNRKTAIPFGPFLALGSVITLFGGHFILKVYLG